MVISNSWLAKIFGAFVGYVIAGPVGILLGLIVSNIFIRRFSQYKPNPHRFYFQEKNQNVQKIFFETSFAVMGYLAKADGRVTENELEVARELMRRMHLNSEQKLIAMRLFNEGKKSSFQLAQHLVQLRRACNNNPELLKLFIDIQYEAAKTDGLTRRKIQVLDLIFTQLGFIPFHKQYRFYEDFGTYNSEAEPEASAHQEYARASSDSYSSYNKYNYKPSSSNIDHAYALLEVSPQASKQEVKKAYRRLLSKNHPDKLIAQGLPQEMIRLANEKTQKIVKAYELICTNKGW